MIKFSGKKLYRSREQRVVGGVASGLAEYFEVDPIFVRIVFLLLAVVSDWGPVVVLYLILMVTIPDRSPGVSDEHAENSGGKEPTSSRRWLTVKGRRVGGILILLGALAFLDYYFSFVGVEWGVVWPIIVLVLGVVIFIDANKESGGKV